MARSVYDNWERLFEATMKREENRRLAFSPSIATTTTTTTTMDTTVFSSTSKVYSFEKSIQLAYSLIRALDKATLSRTECLELKSSVQKLVGVLHQAARASHLLYDRPARRITHQTEDVLVKAVTLGLNCRRLKRLFRSINPIDFQRISLQLSNCIRNVSWLLRGDEYLLLPPIASEEPFLYRIWEPIAILYMCSDDEQYDATASLVYWVRDNELYRKLFIEEGGLQPLLRVLNEGKLEAQKNAVMVIATLGKDSRNVEHLIDAGVCSVLARILEEGPTKLQPVVAWALSELTSNGHIFGHHFRPQDIVALLVSHLNSEAQNDDDVSNLANEKTISTMEMAAVTLWNFVKVDSNTHYSMMKSRTLLCFAAVLESGPKVVQYYCALTLMEITERDADLRTRSGFKPNTPACRAILDQLYRIINEAAHPELLVPCIKTIGNLARTINAVSETGMISPLVKSLEETQEGKVCKEACVALAKYAYPDNFLSMNRSKAILEGGGVKQLVVLVYVGEQIVQSSALILLCYIAQNVPHSAHLAEAEVMAMLEWASKQPSLMQDEEVKKLLIETKTTLERYQCRGSKEHY